MPDRRRRSCSRGQSGGAGAAAEPRPARSPRALAVGALALAFVCALAALDSAFVGSPPQQQRLEIPRFQEAREPMVARRTKSRMWQRGEPNFELQAYYKQKMPSVTNMKDQYYIVWVRSKKVKAWKPVNIISGAEVQKNMKKVSENDLAKAVGVGQLADWQFVRSIGLQLYGQKEEVNKNAVSMHPMLKWAPNGSLEYGYKEITNNTEFNKDPGKFMNGVNISLIPPEEELRNLFDDAGDAVKDASTEISKVGDNVRGFLNGLR